MSQRDGQANGANGNAAGLNGTATRSPVEPTRTGEPVTAEPGAARPAGELSISRQLAGKRLVIVGGSGFLGKVFWVMLLRHFPEVERLYLVLRGRGELGAVERFEREIATSAALEPLRTQYGEHFDALLAEKIHVIEGDIVQPFCGLPPEVRDDMRGEVAAVVNASGVVDFDPPLDLALEVNAFGVQNLVSLARDLGPCPLLHTSTCFVAGDRTGFIEERDPREHPFPRAHELEQAHWDPSREIAECLDIVEQARHRADDAFRQSRFLAEAKANLEAKYEPTTGAVLDAEIVRIRRKFVEARLAEMGTERAQFWGWANTYTYTKSLGEQIAVNSGLRFTIVRPAVVESSVRFPFPGWNEGINTSAPLIFAIRQGQPSLPGSDHHLDLIPVDMVASGMLLALAELIEGTAPPVYQFGSSDTNPVSMSRIFELTGLYKRHYYRSTQKGGPLVSALQARYEGTIQNPEAFERFGPKAIAKGARTLSGLMRKVAIGRVEPLLSPSADALEKLAVQQDKLGRVLGQFAPFTAVYDYTFRCDNTRAALARVSAEERSKLIWEPEKIDWRVWMLEVHLPGLEKWVFPEIEKRINRPRPAPRRHESLVAMLDESARRFDLAVALQMTHAEGLSRISFRDWQARSRACAARLQRLGVSCHDRVALAAKNNPDWPIAFFGILTAGATVVPLDAEIDAETAERLLQASGAKLLLGDSASKERIIPERRADAQFISIREAAAPPERAELDDASLTPVGIEPTDLAMLVYTSGTTGDPKGVMLSHQNIASLLASLGPLFPLSRGDRVLSVLPLHHTFELSCGLLLPLSRGARVVYLDELNAERLSETLERGQITAMVGVPALWQMLERRIRSRIDERGPLAARAFDFAVDVHRSLGKATGLDAGRLLFGPVHAGLGGHLKYLVSGGAALPSETHELFAGLGLHLAEGYGLTEAAPVLTVAQGSPKARAGHVGRAISGVELRIEQPDERGVGEVLARGPNVMLGYADNPDATRQVLGADGWLRTGDLGKLDHRGNLTIVGRAKDTIVASNGENVYPDDVEARLGSVPGVRELAIVGLSEGERAERVACAAVPEEGSGEREERFARARAELQKAVSKLPPAMRPAHIYLVDAALPRTATRKVKRREVSAMLERIRESQRLIASEAQNAEQGPKSDRDLALVRAAIAPIARRSPASVRGENSLRGDLGFDSLMLLELLVSLEAQLGATVDAERVSHCETVEDVAEIVRQVKKPSRVAPDFSVEHATAQTPELPPVFRQAAMRWMGQAQSSFYDKVMQTKITGRANIPLNRSVIVVANHSSHLDMGLVKYALGEYGKNLHALAAQDYFFEGNTWRKAYFENLTNLVPIARNGSVRQSLRQAGELISSGKVVLIFPEGTRSTDGRVGEFKPLVAHLALEHNVDILPVWLGGTHRALPKGATLPRSRDLQVRIGTPLEVSRFRELIKDYKLASGDKTRLLTRLSQRAIVDLSQGKQLNLDTVKLEELDQSVASLPSMQSVFSELTQRFVKGSVSDPISYYFSLGDREKWTLWLDPQSCRVAHGKAVDVADCVLKTSPDIFTKIVRERYSPSPNEFLSGVVKSNNIPLLLTFQKAFKLKDSPPPAGE